MKLPLHEFLFVKATAPYKCTLKTSSVESLIVNCSAYDLSINDFFILLGADGQGVCHQVVNETWIALRKAVHGCKCRRINDR